MTRVFFVRHAQPLHSFEDDRTRPLTVEGARDTHLVLKTLEDKDISAVYCSPYKRSIDTVKSTAKHFGLEIKTDERLREREKGVNGNGGGGRSPVEMFGKRWSDHDFHEEGGESISMVQRRNIEALTDILAENENNSIMIGTHGTALSSILNWFDPSFGLEDFLRIIDFMPYIIELDIEDGRLIDKKEIAYIKKEFR